MREGEEREKIIFIFVISAGFSAEMFSRRFQGRKTSLGVGLCAVELGVPGWSTCWTTDGW